MNPYKKLVSPYKSSIGYYSDKLNARNTIADNHFTKQSKYGYDPTAAILKPMPPREMTKTNLDKPGKKMGSPPKTSIHLGNFQDGPSNNSPSPR